MFGRDRIWALALSMSYTLWYFYTFSQKTGIQPSGRTKMWSYQTHPSLASPKCFVTISKSHFHKIFRKVFFPIGSSPTFRHFLPRIKFDDKKFSAKKLKDFEVSWSLFEPPANPFLPLPLFFNSWLSFRLKIVVKIRYFQRWCQIFAMVFAQVVA